MRKRAALLLGLALSLAAAPACGRKGPLALPPGREPQPVAALAAVAGPGAVTLSWIEPVKTVAGRPLGPLAAAEVWVFDRDQPAAGAAPSPEIVEKRARLVRRIPASERTALGRPAAEGAGPTTFTYELPPETALPARLAFTVRVVDAKGRVSAFAVPAAVEVPGRAAAGVAPAALPGVC